MAGVAVLPTAQRIAKAQTYPTRPITIIVPFAPGGGTDVSARVVGEHMSRTLGQQFVVENFPGAGGTTGSIRAMRATPDGYTIEMGHIGTHAVSVWLYPQLAYKPDVDFEPIGLAMETPLVIVARKDFPPRNLEEFIAYVKADSEKLNMAHAGVGSIMYSFGLMLNSILRVRPTLVPFNGGGLATSALLAGQVDYACGATVDIAPHVHAGALKAYAIAADERSPALPNVPTTKEAGLPEFKAMPWFALFAQGAHRDQFWTNSATRSTRPWMIKKFAVDFLTWVVTFLTKQVEGSRRSRRLSKTKSLAGRPSSRRRTLIGNVTGRRGLPMSALGY
jgi:tripartite-type tricarboxylate transporter receptor subunit TctC